MNKLIIWFFYIWRHSYSQKLKTQVLFSGKPYLIMYWYHWNTCTGKYHRRINSLEVSHCCCDTQNLNVFLKLPLQYNLRAACFRGNFSWNLKNRLNTEITVEQRKNKTNLTNWLISLTPFLCENITLYLSIPTWLTFSNNISAVKVTRWWAWTIRGGRGQSTPDW